MKTIVNKILLVAAAVLVLASCAKSEEAALKKIAGDWYYETVESEVPVQVYASFAKDPE